VIASTPANDRIYVGSRNGLIVSLDDDPGAAATEAFLDLRDRVAVVWDGGFLGLVFHPEFGNDASPFAGTFYVYYSSHCPLDASGDVPDLEACDEEYPRGPTEGFFNAYLRLSRFEVLGPGLGADPNSEQVLINIRLYNDSHRGGGMAFRTDGKLYVTIGDQFRYDTAQDIVDTLEGGTMRLATDVTDHQDGTWSCPAGSHMPRRSFDSADEISGRHYCIPDDNPWLDADGGIFEEYCSIGHRNPHRLARDPITDRLWSGEVGEASREEINLIECGNNYGWPFREGTIAGVRPEPASFLGELTDPVIDFTRDEARALIGGYVYRGSKFPELVGDYLAGDYATNHIWAISLDEETMVATKDYLTDFTVGNLGTWGQDNNGEVFMGTVAGMEPLYTLARIDDEPIPDPPALLSQIGAFADMEAATPSDVWLPYALNQPFWSDGAVKSRFIAIPSDGERDSDDERVAFSPSANWSFPTGTVLMKHFELPLDEGDTTDTVRLETRFLVLAEDGHWYGLTYRWRQDQQDAELLPAEATSEFEVRQLDGTVRAQTWYFPSRSDCLRCHRKGPGGALGLRTHQLNRDLVYPNTTRPYNQLSLWNELHLFSPSLDEASISTMASSPALEDVTAPLQDRARSWFDSNCSHCHQPGEASAGFDARFTTPFAAQGYLWTEVRDDLGNPDTVVIYPGEPELSAAWKRAVAVGPLAMPPLAKSRAEGPAVDLLGDWIERIDPVPLQAGLRYEYYELTGLTELPDYDVLTPVRVGTVSTPDISVREVDDGFAFRFTGFLQITTAGDYTFATSSDDGSQLFVDGSLVVDNDGRHALNEVSAQATLSAGYHSVAITMFEATGGEILDVSWSGPDTADAKVPLGPNGLYHQPSDGPANSSPVLMGPGDQRSRRGDAIVVELEATDADGDALYFDALGLPPGLVIDHDSGRISGTIIESGNAVVTASVSDGPAVSVAHFQWVVDAN
jgi:uncharacterized repeat protein (TIGR03806 family)